ncbi:MAG: galactokinase family protein [Pseudomonadota bacterium]
MLGANSVTVSAPGSIMLTGEHAVVHGAPAIVAAIEQRVTVTVAALPEPILTIASDIAPPETTALVDLRPEGIYRFVNAAVLACSGKLAGGLNIRIQSEIDSTLGLGSSAAVTIAVLAALSEGVTADLHTTALAIVRKIQGRGSGADLAASLWGGVQSYQITGEGPAAVQPLPAPPPLSHLTVAHNTPTRQARA